MAESKHSSYIALWNPLSKPSDTHSEISNAYAKSNLYANKPELFHREPNRDFYYDRISELVEIAKYEGGQYNKESEAYFWRFINKITPVNKAGLTLTDDGNLIAVWDDNNDNYFDVEFIEDKTLEYVAFNDSNEYEEGSGNIDDILRCVDRFNFECLLGVNVEQKAIEQNHNVVRYAGHGKIDPITGNVVREAFRLREMDKGLSVNWLEYFADNSKQEQLKKVMQDMKSSDWSIGVKGLYAELNVGETINEVLNECGIAIDFSHDPEDKNPSHALIQGLRIPSRTPKKPSVILARLASKRKHSVSDLQV